MLQMFLYGDKTKDLKNEQSSQNQHTSSFSLSLTPEHPQETHHTYNLNNNIENNENNNNNNNNNTDTNNNDIIISMDENNDNSIN